MRLYMLVAFLAFVLPAAAWAAQESCTPSTAAAQDWGDITTLSPTANCTDKGAPPDNDDIIKVADGGTVNVVDNITYGTGLDGALVVQSGGTFTADVTATEQVLTIHFSAGQDNITVGGTEYDSVALWQEAGGTIDFQGAYLTNGLATPLWQEVVTHSNNTIWTVDLLSTCDDGASDSPGSEIGGAGSCGAAGGQKNKATLAYTDARNNPEDGSDGDTYLYESIHELTAGMLVCMISGMDRTHCYQLVTIDDGAAIYGLTFRALQLIQPAEAAIDYLVFPKADREQKPITLAAAADAEDKCFYTAGGDLDNDGELVGACAYIYDSNGENGWDRPIRIVRTEDDETCDGTTGGGQESFWFPAALGKDIASGSKAVIAPFCIGRGDKFSVLAPVVLEIEDGNGEWALGDGKILLEGTNSWRGVVVDSSALVLCEGCDWTSDQTHWWNGGTDGGPALAFYDTQSAILSCFSIVGGPQTDDADAIEFDGVTGITQLTDFRIRYSGGRSIFAGGSATQMGQLRMERGVFERIGRDVAGTTDYSIQASTVPISWSAIRAKDIVAIDPTAAAGSRFIENGGLDFAISGLGLIGQPYGGLTALSTSDAANPARVSHLLARGVDTSFSGKTWTGNFITFCDMQDTVLDGTLPMMSNTAPIVLEGCNINTLSTTGAQLLDHADSVGASRVRNNVFHNTTSSNAACSSGTCYAIDLDPDDDTDTVSTVERNLFSFDDDHTTQWTSAFYSTSTTRDKINFGGNAIDNWINDVDNVTTKPIDLDASLAGDSVQRDNMNNCVSNAQATGASSTVTYVDSLNQYSTEPLLGIAADFQYSTMVLNAESRWAQLKCGPMTRTRAPGIGVGHDFLYEITGIDPPERKPLIDEE